MRQSTQLFLFALAALGSQHAAADPESDFAARCAAPGVIWCIGFDDQAEVNRVGQVRYPATSGADSIAANPQAYPDNIAPNGHRYPAVDASQAASGEGSLRLTANPVASANQSGGWYLGSAGISSWPKEFRSGETVYIQWRQRYDFAYTNGVNWSGTGGDGVKQIIIWRDEGSCSDLQVVVVDSASRGYPQAYTNCGGRPLYQCPAGSGSSNCSSYNTDYGPKSGHVQFLYQYGPNSTDFHCMRNFETAEGCGYWRNHHDRWWTYYLEIKIGDPGSGNSAIKGWLSRGNGEPMRQFIDFQNYPWSFRSGRTIENLLFTLYKTGKNNGNHSEATSWYDELIVSSQPIATPEGVGDPVVSACNSPGPGVAPCPPPAITTQ